MKEQVSGLDINASLADHCAQEPNTTDGEYRFVYLTRYYMQVAGRYSVRIKVGVSKPEDDMMS